MAYNAEAFPHQQARTRRFTLGAPRNFTISPDGARVVFLRSPGGDDPRTSLWVYETLTGRERQIASPSALLGGEEEVLSREERARRERSRELAGGIVGYACDEAVTHAVFPVAGKLWWVSLTGEIDARELPSPGGVVGPRPSPDGERVAFLSGAALYCTETSGGGPFEVLAGEETPDVTWGAAEFIAAEEMDRARGFWWAPDSAAVLAARADNSPLLTWWTADPLAPSAAPGAHKYPQAGTDDAVVTLWLVPAARGARRRQAQWDAGRYPYLVSVHWSRGGPPLLLVEQRDHKACAVLTLDLSTMGTSSVAEAADEAWVGWVPGTPAWLDSGELLWCCDEEDTHRLCVDGKTISPPGLQVREVTSCGRSVVFTASVEPEVVEAWEWSAGTGLQRLTEAHGVSRAAGSGAAKVVVSSSMSWYGVKAQVRVEGSAEREIENKAETPVVEPAPHFVKAGHRGLSAALLLPRGHEGAKLPVLMSPYGGPGHQKVTAARSAWLEAQWIADQGFAVLVVDGRGTPGRGPAFEREVYLDLAGPVLKDQVDALVALAREWPQLDLARVGIRGWSFGGYLSALAVLARPDVFHAAVAGAPVTEWRYYDTYYTERYLGHPDREPDAYARTSLLPLATGLRRPLLIVHGLSDDNVYAVHTLALSSALLVAGRHHEVLPLPAITHVASREDVSESLLRYEVDFFRRHLVAGPGPG